SGRVLHPEHSAPRMAEDVDSVQTERLADRVDFLDIELRSPDRRVVRLGYGRPAGSELVVEDDLTLVGEGLVRLHIQPVGAGPAVQPEQRHAAVLPLSR